MKLKALDVITIIALVIVLWYLSGHIKWEEVSAVLAKSNLFYVALGAAGVVLGIVFKTLKLQLLLNNTGKRVKYWDLFLVQCFGLAVSNATPGHAGEPIKIFYMEKFGVNKQTSLIAITWERILDVAIVFAFAGLILLQLPDEFRLAVIAMFIIFVLGVIGVLFWLDPLISKISRFRHFNFLESVTFHKFSPRALLIGLVVTVVAWIFDFVGVMYAFKAIEMDITLLQAASAFSTGTIVGIATLLPGGFGTGDAAIYFVLQPLGYSLAVVTAGLITTRVVTLAPTFILGAISAMILRKK